MIDQSKKVDYEKENECSLCYCNLYEGLEGQSLAQIIEAQKKLLQAKVNGVKLDALNVVKMSQCQGMHFYHKECLEGQLQAGESKSYLKCAVCNISYGLQTGEMPPGTMTWKTVSNRLIGIDGYPNLQSAIEIGYNIPSGKLPDGNRFRGTSRIAYLPDDKDGREILTLMIEAFKRRLTFKVGTSITTGADN